MKKILLIGLFINNMAFAGFEIGANYSNDIEASIQYNFERSDGNAWFPKLSFSMFDKNAGAGIGFKHEMLYVDSMVGYDFDKKTIYTDFDFSLLQKEDKVAIGLGVTKRLHFYKKATDSEIFPKLIINFSI